MNSLSSNDGSPILIRNLAKTYRLGFLMNRTVRALQGLDLEIAPGQVYGLLGPNGAGKSTTIKILMNLVQPSSGTAQVFGQPPSNAAARRELGFLPENPAPYEYLTGREFLTLQGRIGGLSGHELDQRIAEVLGKVEMERAANLQIRRYSKGMVQRICLAQALITHPRLLVLDEPTSGMDPVGRRTIRDLILAERARGTTVLFCTHIISDVESLCDRVAVLVHGKRVREGAVKDLVTAEAAQVELIVEGLSAEAAGSLGVELLGTQQVAGQLILRVSDRNVQALLAKLVAGQARVVRLSPVRYSLEDLFLDALKQSGTGTVGGVIS